MTKQTFEQDLLDLLRQLREMAAAKASETPTNDFNEVAILGEVLGMGRTIRLLEEALAARGITETKQ